jgi:hypothetical protein
MTVKENRGVLLVVLAIFCSTKGRETMGFRSEQFQNEANEDDWILLIELLLRWEAYLNSDLMKIKHVVHLCTKNADSYSILCTRLPRDRLEWA